MSKKQKNLVGTRFLKYEGHRGIERIHVLEHERKSGRYLVAFEGFSSTNGETPIGSSVGPIKGNLSLVQDWVIENYATQDQVKLKRLLKNEKKHRKLADEISEAAMLDWQERQPDVQEHVVPQFPDTMGEYDNSIPF